MNNALCTLPDALGGCTALLRLGLKGNRLSGLPASVGALAALQELYLTGGGGRVVRELRGGWGRGLAGALLWLLAALCDPPLPPFSPDPPWLPLLPDNLLESLPAEMGGMRSLVKLQASTLTRAST